MTRTKVEVVSLEPMSALGGLVAVSLGLGLAAASGFRVFLPPMLLSGGINLGWISPVGQLSLLDGWGAFAVLFAAVILEVGSYLIPWIDNLLDVIATPAAVLAGVGMMGSVLGDFDPIVQWTLAIVGGGGVAGTVQVGTVATRAVSTGTTGGLANPIISIFEAIMAVFVTLLALMAPLIGLVLVIAGTVYAVRMIGRRKKTLPMTAPMA